MPKTPQTNEELMSDAILRLPKAPRFKGMPEMGDGLYVVSHEITRSPTAGLRAHEAYKAASHKFSVIVSLNGYRYTLDYTMGVGHTNAPVFWDVFHCLLLDTTNIERMTFAEWCADCGFNEDSRAAEAIFNKCRDTLPHVLRLLGDEPGPKAREWDEDQCHDRFAHLKTYRL